MTKRTFRIAVIGGGPGGLVLARILQYHGIACKVYEMDTSRDSRGQGGSFDLHPESGQYAIKAAGLWDKFVELARFSADCMRLCDPSGHALIDETTNPRAVQDKPEIDRGALRGLLLDSLEPDTVEWNSKVRKIQAEGDRDVYKIHLETGDIVSSWDLVVGADGAWSKVRSLLTDAKPFYSGVCGVGYSIPDAPVHHVELAQAVGRGSWFTIGDNACIISQINGDHSIKSYFYQRESEDFLDTCGIKWKQSTARREYLDTRWKEWSPLMRRLALDADEVIDVRKLYMLPVGLRWPSRPGVTLIGDAAHLMTPFAGVGVNVAMHDAALLAGLVVAASSSMTLTEALALYEKEMFTRCERYAQLTFENMQRYLSIDGALKVAAAMQRRDKASEEGKGIEVLLGYS